MKKYVDNYMKHHGYCIDDVILCEQCGQEAVDIHHKRRRSLGGSDEIDNLIALCRECHDKEQGN